MGIFDAQDTQTVLEDLLERERAAILSGHYQDLERLVPEKERLLNALSRTRMDPKALTHLREISERNGLLLDAMRAGIGSAIERLKVLNEPQAALKTYDQSGRRTEISAAQAKTSHRV